MVFPSGATEVLPVVTASLFVTIPFSTVNVKSVTTEQPAGAVSSLRVQLPSLRNSKSALLPSNSTKSVSSSIALPFTLTPWRVAPSSLAISVNFALPALSGIGVPPSACLSIFITDFVSKTSIVFPSSDTFLSPSVTTDEFFTTPLSISNVKVVIVVQPSGAAVSSRLYFPSGRYSSSALFPSNSTSLTPSPRASPPFTLTPSSVLSASSAVSLNLALPDSSGIGVPPTSFLSILMIGASSTTMLPFSSL